MKRRMARRKGTWEGGKSNADGMERMVFDWLFGSGEGEDEEGKNIFI